MVPCEIRALPSQEGPAPRYPITLTVFRSVPNQVPTFKIGPRPFQRNRRGTGRHPNLTSPVWRQFRCYLRCHVRARGPAIFPNQSRDNHFFLSIRSRRTSQTDKRVSGLESNISLSQRFGIDVDFFYYFSKFSKFLIFLFSQRFCFLGFKVIREDHTATVLIVPKNAVVATCSWLYFDLITQSHWFHLNDDPS